MNIEHTISILEQKDFFRSLNYEEKRDFLKICHSNFTFYEPHSTCFINPFNSKRFEINILIEAFSK